MRRAAIVISIVACSALADESTYRWIRQIGGSGEDRVIGVAVDSSGNTYVAGSTTSADFPVRNAAQPRPGSAPLWRASDTGSAKLYNTGVNTIVAVAFNPCDARNVFAIGPKSLLRSNDLGETWTSSAVPAGLAPNTLALACAPGVPLTVYANTDHTLLRTRDFEHWDTIDVGHGSIYQIWVDPNRQTLLYARTTQGLVRSMDGGATWETTGVVTYGLTFDSAHPGVVYAPIVQFQPGSNIAIAAIPPAKSIDYGATWTALTPLPGRDVFPQVVFVDPANSNVLYAAGSGFFASSDSGQSWTARPLSIGTPVAIDSATKSIYAISQGAVVVSNDGFATVRALTPSSLPYATSIAASQGVAFVSFYATHDGFAAKLDADGNVVYATYLGGSADDVITAMTIGSDGSVYVAGTTASTDFPTTPGSFRPVAGRSGEKFLAKLNPDGTIAYATYFGGPSDFNSTALAMAVDQQGNAIMAGTTSGGIVTTPGAYQTDFNGFYTGGFLVPLPQPTNAFVTKLSADGSRLIFSTYIGKQSDGANVAALAPDGSIFTGGIGHLFHLSADGSKLLGSTPVGLPVVSLALDGAGGFYAASPAFPGGSNLTRYDGELNSGATLPLPSLINPRVSPGAGDVLVAGGAASTLPTVAPLQGPFAQNTGGVVTIAADFSAIRFSTFTGDARYFAVNGVAAAAGGDIVFAGSTAATQASEDPGDVFIARLAPRVPALRIDSVVNAISILPNALAANENIAITGTGFADDATVDLGGRELAIVERSGNRIVGIVPADFPSDGSVRVTVRSGADVTNGVLMPVAAASPAVLTASGAATGPGLIRNADGSLNSASNPAAEADTITIYVNGGSAGVPVAVKIDGFDAVVAGTAMTTVDRIAGPVLQVTAVIPRPSDYAASNPILGNFHMPPTVSVQVISAGVSSQPGVTMSIK